MRCGWQETANTLLKHLDEMGQRLNIRKHVTLSDWKSGLGQSPPFSHSALFHDDTIKSCERGKEKQKSQGHLETPALLPEISPPAVEWCHSKPSVVPESLFNLYHRTAEEHHATRPAYISEAPLSHTLPTPTHICFVSTWVPQQPLHFFLNTSVVKRWSAHDCDSPTHSGCIHMQLIDIWALNGWAT